MPRTHGMANTPLYKCWENMRQRAGNRAGIYPTYASVGVDERWQTFQGFLDNQPPGRAFQPGLCLSRVGDTGDYTPKNTRWLTRSENTKEQHKQPKSHCINGHPYTEENTIHASENGKSRRACRTCACRAKRNYRARQRDRGARPS